MKRSAYFIATIFLMLPTHAGAGTSNDGDISNFTRKISAIYSISKSCEKALSPGPKEYMAQIEEYMEKLYPNGAGYWVIQKNAPPINNTQTCINLIQEQLLGYQKELEAFQNNNPNRSAPPVFTMYSWNKNFVPEELAQAMRDLKDQEKKKATLNSAAPSQGQRFGR